MRVLLMGGEEKKGEVPNAESREYGAWNKVTEKDLGRYTLSEHRERYESYHNSHVETQPTRDRRQQTTINKNQRGSVVGHSSLEVLEFADVLPLSMAR